MDFVYCSHILRSSLHQLNLPYCGVLYLLYWYTLHRWWIQCNFWARMEETSELSQEKLSVGGKQVHLRYRLGVLAFLLMRIQRKYPSSIFIFQVHVAGALTSFVFCCKINASCNKSAYMLQMVLNYQNHSILVYSNSPSFYI